MTAPRAPLVPEPFTPPAPAAGEVLVEVAGCGVCHTDLGYFHDGVRPNHALPLVLGHEISGRVVAAGPGAGDWRDRLVIVPAVMPCGTCDLCRRGHETICRNQKMPGNDIHGGFASHIVVPARGLCEVRQADLDRAGLELADVAVVADALSTPYQAVQRAGIEPGTLAVVIGAGGVGGYCVQVAAAMGAHVVAIDVDDGRLAALRGYGAGWTLNPAGMDLKAIKAAVSDYARGQGLRGTEWRIFECSGSAAGQGTAWGLLVHGATLCVIGFTMDRIEVRLSNLMAFDARAIGNWGCAPALYPEALKLVLDGRVRVLPFIEKHPLAEINSVFDGVQRHAITRRAVLIPE
jgi:6-hydroxycyclohex-1-ene-1-carbonyl-CoA dehydrogenase